MLGRLFAPADSITTGVPRNRRATVLTSLNSF
jgi:hypothetical protein